MIEILQQDAPVLRAPAEPVNLKDFDSPRLKKIVADMKEALEKEEDGVAIAAPQIGVPLRIFVVSPRAFFDEHNTDGDALPPADTMTDLGSKPTPQNLVYINPKIIKLSRRKRWVPEGCLSVRWLYGETSRADRATVQAYDEHGKLFTRGAGGLLAQIFQHETDHLDGILFIDHARNVEMITREEQERMREEHRQHHKRENA